MKSGRFGMVLAGLLVVVAVVLAGIGYLYLSRLRTSARAAAGRELSAIADLKLNQIRNWREERLSDAHFFASARFVAQDLSRFLAEPNQQDNLVAVLNWLRLLKGGERYSEVVIFDAQGKQLLALPSSAAPPGPVVREAIEKALRRREIAITDLHRKEPGGVVELDIVFPVFQDANPDQGKVIAAILLEVDARQFLFPLIQSWPTPSPTAETLLVRQEGEHVVFLNDLRHRPQTALTLRERLSSPELPAAQVLRGETRVIDGVDYRGVPVVAAGRFIPGTSWALVSKVDQAEVYGPLHQQVRMVLLVLGLALIASVLIAGLWWRQRSNQFLRRELVLEKEGAALAERVAHLMRHANDIILLVSPQGRLLEANERALQAYGYGLEELKGKRVHDLRTPETVVGVDRDLARANAEGSAFFETVHQRKDGGTFPVEVSIRKVRVGGEDIILSIVRDITQRKAYELEIERLNRLYAVLSQVNHVVVRSKARPELLDGVCQVLIRLGGFQMAWCGWVDGETGRVVPLTQCGDRAGYLTNIQVFVDERPEGRGPVGTAIREGRACVSNDMLGDPNLLPWREAGIRSGWRSMGAFPIRQEGVIRGALAVYSQQPNFFGPREQALLEEAAGDVSFGLDILRNEQRRREAEERLRLQAAALQAAANSIAITGRDGTIQWVNPAFERLTGYSAAEAIGQNPRLLKSGQQEGAFYRRMWEEILAGRVWHEEVINKRKDGSLYIEEMTITPVKDSQGEITQFVAIKQDVTARKQAEEAVRQARDELARANAELEQRVQERTAQLRESVAELEAFSYSMSHDLRSPLRTIQTFLSIVLEEQRDKLGGEGVGMLEKVCDAARRMDQLVTDVLALSKVSRAQMQLERVDTDRLVRQIVQERPELHPPRAQVRIESPLAPVVGHEASLTQCLTNLLSNGAKFVAPGVLPQLRVWTEVKEAKVRLWVADNGIGIPREAQEKIFGMFERLHRQAEYEGTGIGLAIVKRAVERMGGRVGVESEPGRGSRFWVELPAAERPGGS